MITDVIAHGPDGLLGGHVTRHAVSMRAACVVMLLACPAPSDIGDSRNDNDPTAAAAHGRERPKVADPRQRASVQFGLRQAKRELAEGDAGECTEAVEPARPVLRGQD